MHAVKPSFKVIALLPAACLVAFLSFLDRGVPTHEYTCPTSRVVHAQFSIDVNEWCKYADRVEVLDLSTSFTRIENSRQTRSLIDGSNVSWSLHRTLFRKPLAHIQIVGQHLSVPVVLRRLQI